MELALVKEPDTLNIRECVLMDENRMITISVFQNTLGNLYIKRFNVESFGNTFSVCDINLTALADEAMVLIAKKVYGY